jgi:ribonuclease HI
MRPPKIPFPLSYPKQAPAQPPPPPYLFYNLQASYHIDGASRAVGKERSGACAFLKQTATRSSIFSSKLSNATNNFAEFKIVELALKDAVKEQHQTILIVTDSQMVYDFVTGLNNISLPHLKELLASIRLLIKQIARLYISKVWAHRRSTVIGNQIADALCTWALNSKREHQLHMQLTGRSLATRLMALNKGQIPTNYNGNSSLCLTCLKKNDHNHHSCCICSYQPVSELTTPCLCCLSVDHFSENCPLHFNETSRPVLAKGPALPPPERNPSLKDITEVDFDSIAFPRHQSGSQFDDYFETVFSTMYFAKNDPARQEAAEKAIAIWSANYRVDRNAIRRTYPHRVDSCMESFKTHSAPPEDILLTRAKKAAALGVDARAGDVAKALRSAPPLPLTDEIEVDLKRLYPIPIDDHTIFEPTPLANYEISRHRVARYIMSRSRRSHPGTLGLTYGILQLYCMRTYKKEARDSPDPRWTLFCELISMVMTGNALHMSPMLHIVFGSFFDKNFEKPGSSPSIRNIGIEETLLRVPSALVFEDVLQDALDRGFLTAFDLGAGKKSGAEIFAKIAEMCSTEGCIIAVMDVNKAFNNLRRRDIKAAVADFNNPLFTAFVHFLFGRNPSVIFKDRLSARTLVCELMTGILQGNPICVFLFALTLAFLLRTFRDKYKNDTIVTTFVDDMKVISRPSAALQYPHRLREFFDTLAAHGLLFDFTNDAKTSVYSTKPLPLPIQLQLHEMGLRTQTDGIAPCKIPIGTPAFVALFLEKAATKLKARFESFEALWPALLTMDANARRPCRRTHEQFLNLIRLSFCLCLCIRFAPLTPLLANPMLRRQQPWPMPSSTESSHLYARFNHPSRLKSAHENIRTCLKPQEGLCNSLSHVEAFHYDSQLLSSGSPTLHLAWIAILQ